MGVVIVGGTGKQGYGLALRWALAGESVVIGSRRAEKAAEAAEALNREAGREAAIGLENLEALRRAGTRAKAGAGPGAVVLTVPYGGRKALLAQLAPALAGRIVIDTTVPLREGDPQSLDLPPEGSAAQQAQALLPGAKVAAAFHTLSASLLRKREAPIEGDVLVCADAPDAKEEALRLAGLLGARGLDAGPLDRAQTLERLAALVIALNIRYRRRHIGVRFTGL